MEFLGSYADSVTVLAAGKVLAEGSYALMRADPRRLAR
jgi:urea transport system ATP-binding protein